MADITLTFSKKEFKLLLKHVVLGNWMLEAHRDEKDDAGKDNMAFYQKVLALATKNGLGEGIALAPDSQEYSLSEELEEKYQGDIQAYDDEVFWENLEDELAIRDFVEQHGEKTIEEMDGKKKFTLVNKEVEKYNHEFTKHGVKNLRIVK